MELKKKVLSGVKWNTVSVGINSLVQILRIFVLSRFLSTSDFGILAIALAVISFTDIFSDLGFTISIIHKQNITKEQYSSVFWLNLLFGILITSILFFVSPYIARYYAQPILQEVINVLSLIIITNAFGKVFQTIRTKELDFKFISIVSIVSAICGFVLMFAMAFYGYGIWSLVVGTLFQNLVRQILYFVVGLRSSTIYFHLNVLEIKEFLSIGSYQIGAQIMDFIAKKIDIFIIGSFLGVDSLGIYNLAKEFVLKIYGLFAALSRDIATATLAKIQNDKFKVLDYFTKYTSLYTIISVPVFSLIILFPHEICSFVYGINKAEMLTFPLQALAVFGLFNVLCAPSSSLILSLGKTNYSFRWTIISAVINIILVSIAAPISFNAVLYTEIFIAVILYLLNWKLIINKLIYISIFKYIKMQYKPMLISFFLIIVLTFLYKSLTSTIVTFFFFSFLFLFLYLLLILIMTPHLKIYLHLLKRHKYDS